MSEAATNAGQKAMSDASLETRVVTVETKLDNVIRAIGDLTAAVKEIASQPKSIAWREIAITATTTLGMFWYIGNYLESQHAKNVAVDKYRITQLETQMRLIAPIAQLMTQGQSK